MSDTVLFRNIQKNGDKIEFICNKGKRIDPFVGCLIEWEDADHYVGLDILAKGAYHDSDCFLPDTFEIYNSSNDQQKKINALKEQLAEANEVIEMVVDNTKMPHEHKDYYERLCCLSERGNEYQQKWSDKK